MARDSIFVPVTKKHTDGLQKLLVYFDTQTVIAEALGLSKQGISNWFRGRVVIPEGHARRLVDMVGNRVTLYDLRPDFVKRDKKSEKVLAKKLSL